MLFTELLTLVGFEFALRLTGQRPMQVYDSNIAAKFGEYFFALHPNLGYVHLPGEFEISLTKDYSFVATNLESGLGITHPLETYDIERNADEIWVLGGSVTYGWSINDDETYSWLL